MFFYCFNEFGCRFVHFKYFLTLFPLLCTNVCFIVPLNGMVCASVTLSLYLFTSCFNFILSSSWQKFQVSYFLFVTFLFRIYCLERDCAVAVWSLSAPLWLKLELQARTVDRQLMILCIAVPLSIKMFKIIIDKLIEDMCKLLLLAVTTKKSEIFRI